MGNNFVVFCAFARPWAPAQSGQLHITLHSRGVACGSLGSGVSNWAFPNHHRSPKSATQLESDLR